MLRPRRNSRPNTGLARISASARRSSRRASHHWAAVSAPASARSSGSSRCPRPPAGGGRPNPARRSVRSASASCAAPARGPVQSFLRPQVGNVEMEPALGVPGDQVLRYEAVLLAMQVEHGPPGRQGRPPPEHGRTVLVRRVRRGTDRDRLVTAGGTVALRDETHQYPSPVTLDRSPPPRHHRSPARPGDSAPATVALHTKRSRKCRTVTGSGAREHAGWPARAVAFAAWTGRPNTSRPSGSMRSASALLCPTSTA